MSAHVLSCIIEFIKRVGEILQFSRTSLISKKMSNDQELIQSDPISCPQNQKGNN